MFGICISIGVRQLKFISLSLFECSFQVSFFSRFSNSGSSHTEPRSLSKQCMQRQCPEKTERHIFRSQTHRRIYKFFRRGEGGVVAASLDLFCSSVSCHSCTTIKKTGLICQIRSVLTFLNSCKYICIICLYSLIRTHVYFSKLFN